MIVKIYIFRKKSKKKSKTYIFSFLLISPACCVKKCCKHMLHVFYILYTKVNTCRPECTYQVTNKYMYHAMKYFAVTLCVERYFL